jgi:hypothetical protein
MKFVFGSLLSVLIRVLLLLTYFLVVHVQAAADKNIYICKTNNINLTCSPLKKLDLLMTDGINGSRGVSVCSNNVIAVELTNGNLTEKATTSTTIFTINGYDSDSDNDVKLTIDTMDDCLDDELITRDEFNENRKISDAEGLLVTTTTTMTSVMLSVIVTIITII